MKLYYSGSTGYGPHIPETCVKLFYSGGGLKDHEPEDQAPKVDIMLTFHKMYHETSHMSRLKKIRKERRRKKKHGRKA